MKRCEYCNRPLKRTKYPSGEKESLSHFRERKYCNPRCQQLARRGKCKPRYCPMCGKEIPQLRKSGVWMSPSVYARRKYCCREHADAARTIEGHTTGQGYKGRRSKQIFSPEEVEFLRLHWKRYDHRRCVNHLGITENNLYGRIRQYQREVGPIDFEIKPKPPKKPLLEELAWSNFWIRDLINQNAMIKNPGRLGI